ncbi:Anterior gradient protein 3 -like [Scophthalmus maximus]|uniref:Anterior gradient protein 3-like n=1 Tax=Scophthalmus maximus TaxID=52904 RepID=A0A2U9CAM9_SCOMX|nr:Anterior gradient protein 3 -like [Scophthalmus maximus]
MPPFFLEHYYNDYFKATVECCRVVVVKLNRFLSAALKKAFVAKKPIQKMAKEDFIMVNLVEETEDPNMAPDGHYVPRILFIDPSMTVRRDIAGKYNNRLYTYQPEDMDLLAKNMKKAKRLLLHTEL